MDQGVIRSLKAHYCRKILRLCIKALYKNMSLPKITITEAMENLSFVWSGLPAQTIMHCLRMAGKLYKSKSLNSNQTIRII